MTGDQRSSSPGPSPPPERRLRSGQTPTPGRHPSGPRGSPATRPAWSRSRPPAPGATSTAGMITPLVLPDRGGPSNSTARSARANLDSPRETVRDTPRRPPGPPRRAPARTDRPAARAPGRPRNGASQPAPHAGGRAARTGQCPRARRHTGADLDRGLRCCVSERGHSPDGPRQAMTTHTYRCHRAPAVGAAAAMDPNPAQWTSSRLASADYEPRSSSIRGRTKPPRPPQPARRDLPPTSQVVDRRDRQVQQLADLRGGHHLIASQPSTWRGQRRDVVDLWGGERHGEHHAPPARTAQPHLGTSSKTSSDNFGHLRTTSPPYTAKPLHTRLSPATRSSAEKWRTRTSKTRCGEPG